MIKILKFLECQRGLIKNMLMNGDEYNEFRQLNGSHTSYINSLTSYIGGELPKEYTINEKKLNIYEISRDDDSWEYYCGCYDSAIIYAENEEDARNIHPDGYLASYEKNKGSWLRDWVKPEDVNVIFLGIAKNDAKRGVILASYNES